MKSVPGKTRRKFDDTFKREAVQNWLSSGKSAETISDELGIVSSMLHAWKKRFAPGSVGLKSATSVKPGSVNDLQSQLDQALRENRHLKEQRDILKKTLGILSEPSGTATYGSRR
jgi:transposase-like protein